MKIAVLGIGNILCKDDGLGVAAANILAEQSWPGNVTVYDAGTAVMKLWDVFMNHEMIIIIDALRGDGAPGTIYRLTPGDLAEGEGAILSLHDLGIVDVLRLAGVLNRRPRVIIFGMEPADLSWEIGLSEPVRENLAALVACIRRELSPHLGNM